MTMGLERLDADAGTEVIVIVSKPPTLAVVQRVMETVRHCKKPVVVNFLDSDAGLAPEHAIVARTLEDAAVKAVAALTGEDEGAVRGQLLAQAEEAVGLAKDIGAALASSQRYVRGLFAGDTFTNESTMILCDLVDEVYTNGGIKKATALPDPRRSQGHTCVDLGDDLFTVGKPHPMLEPSLRRERLLQEAADPETAVILLDVPIGYGVHPDPGGLLAQYIQEAKGISHKQGRALPVVASVCGVDADPQNRSLQVQKVKEAGAVVMSSNAQATYLAYEIAAGQRGSERKREG